MSALAKVLATHRFGSSTRVAPGGGTEVMCWCGTWTLPQDHAAHVEDALTAAGLAVVELPEPDADGEWDGQDDHVGWWVSTDTDGGKPFVIPHVMGSRLLPGAACRFAAALLAAANLAKAARS